METFFCHNIIIYYAICQFCFTKSMFLPILKIVLNIFGWWNAKNYIFNAIKYLYAYFWKCKYWLKWVLNSKTNSFPTQVFITFQDIIKCNNFLKISFIMLGNLTTKLIIIHKYGFHWHLFCRMDQMICISMRSIIFIYHYSLKECGKG